MGDHARFEMLVLPHLDAGYNLARWLARNADDAEDVVQDACVRAMKYIGALDARDAKPWFLTIVRHAFYDWCERNRRADVDVAATDVADATIDANAIDPEQALLRHAEANVLADAVASLPLAFREVLILREMEALSYREIARIAGVPIGTVMSRLARARALLRGSATLRAVTGRTNGGER